MRKKFVSGIILVALIACVGMASAFSEVTRFGPYPIQNNDFKCSDIIPGYEGSQFSIEGNTDGTYVNSDGFRVTAGLSDSQDITWRSLNYPVDVIYIKDGASFGYYYKYSPAQMADPGPGLSAPINGGGNAGDTSHVTFCYSPHTTAPEFPAVALPVGMIIGFLGVIVFIRGTKDN